MKKVLSYAVLLGALSLTNKASASPTPLPVAITPTLTVSSSTAVQTAMNLTVSSPTANVGAYSAGYYSYITHIHLEMYAAGTLTGGATPVVCTTTNLSSALTWRFPTAQATGVQFIVDEQFDNPIQVTQGAQMMISCPATASVIWSGHVAYFQGQ